MKTELAVVGMVLVLVGLFLIMLSALLSEGEVEAGGVIMIGPIPIVFGTGRAVIVASVLAVLMMLLWITLFLAGRE